MRHDNFILNNVERNDNVSTVMPTRQRQQRVDWVGLAQVVVVLALCGCLYSVVRNKQASNQSWHEVQQWIKQAGLTKYESLFKERGKFFDLNCILGH